MSRRRFELAAFCKLSPGLNGEDLPRAVSQYLFDVAVILDRKVPIYMKDNLMRGRNLLLELFG
jgi:hypothetical protein